MRFQPPAWHDYSVKAADISDDVFIEAVAATAPSHPGMTWRSRWSVRETLEQKLGIEIPEKLFLAKARKLGLKGKLLGCTNCDCRGDYHLPGEA
jgi:hypothetical protein